MTFIWMAAENPIVQMSASTKGYYLGVASDLG